MMKKKFTKVVSLALAMMASLTTVSTGLTSVMAEDTSVINSETTWSYLDDGTDPAGDSTAEGYNRTSWTTGEITWEKSGKGAFGALNGAAPTSGVIPTTVVNQYKDATAETKEDISTYYFRTTVNVADASAVKTIVGSITYSQSAAAFVYINGHMVAEYNNSSTDRKTGTTTYPVITSNTQYVSNACKSTRPGEEERTETKISTKTSTFYAWNNLSDYLVNGDNIIAVEIHQSCPTNQYIYFDMSSLTFSSQEYMVKNVSLSVGSDETERNFTWYSNYETAGTLLVAKQSELVNGEMPEGATKYTPTVKASSTKTGFYSNQTTVKKLENNTTYAYQIVNGDAKTEIHTFTTGTGSSFSFAFAGDPQIGSSGNDTSDGSGWDATLNLINSSEQLKGVDFLLSAGDQVESATDEDQYDNYLEHSTLYDLPVATNVGNHDSSSSAYDEHFNVPNESTHGTTAASGDYYFVYNNVLFMNLNSNNTSTADHKAFMEEAIEATKDQNITWKIVTFHHSIYSVASHATDKDILQRREELSPVFKELDIDVVLMGHDHVYCRTYMMDGTTPMTDASIYDTSDYSSITNPEGILYVTANSASGSKFYNLKNEQYEYAAVKNQENVPNISRVSISDDQFTITTYRTTDMSVVDTFTINHKQSYNITVDEAENGTASADLTSAISGKTVTLTATANDGYEFAGWEVVRGNVTIDENNQFVMPEEEVEIKPVFKKLDDSSKSDDSSSKSDDSSSKTDDSSSKKSSTQPNTGDTSNILLFGSILGIASIGAVIFGVIRKKA